MKEQMNNQSQTPELQLMSNRTGGMLMPEELAKTIEGAEEFSPLTDGDETSLNVIRAQYAEQALIGSMPAPATETEFAATMSAQAEGKDLNLLLDKLSERIAFECSGTRLYDSLIAKCQLASPAQIPPGLTLEQLMHIREEEQQHLGMLIETVVELGGDPTVLTPCADVTATASSGLCKVVSDPRTTVLQALNAMLVAELTDNDGWTMLMAICDDLGLPEISQRFQQALEQEDEHLENVRQWLFAGTLTNAETEELAIKTSTMKKGAQSSAARTAVRGGTQAGGRKQTATTKKAASGRKSASSGSKGAASKAKAKQSGTKKATSSRSGSKKTTANKSSGSQRTSMSRKSGSKASSAKSTSKQNKSTSMKSKSRGGKKGPRAA